jgi:hypothetical protein
VYAILYVMLYTCLPVHNSRGFMITGRGVTILVLGGAISNPGKPANACLRYHKHKAI